MESSLAGAEVLVEVEIAARSWTSTCRLNHTRYELLSVFLYVCVCVCVGYKAPAVSFKLDSKIGRSFTWNQSSLKKHETRNEAKERTNQKK